MRTEPLGPVTESDLVAIVEHSPIAMAVATPADGILHANRSLEQLTGHNREELVGRRLIDVIVHPDDVEEVQWVGARVMQAEAVEVRHRTLTRSGEVRYVRGSIAPMLESGGVVRWAIAQYVDESSLVASAKALEESRNGLRSFAEDVAHDLRTPLTAISGFAELLSDALEDRLAADEQQVLETIQRSSNRAAEAVALALARVDSVRGSEARPVTVGEVVHRVRDLLSPQLLAEGAAIDVTIDGTVVADQQVLFEVLLNLCQNAIKYRSDRRPVIEIEVASASQTIEVRDNGKGIDPNDWKAVFERRRKLDQASDGFGLGLARSRRLIESLGGRLYVGSSDDNGTVMVVALPHAWEDRSAVSSLA